MSCGADPDSSDLTDPTQPPDQPPTQEPWPEPVFDPSEFPLSVPTLNITIADGDRALLENDPYGASDVMGSFTDENGDVFENVEVNFRGAYALRNLINSGQRRNWKVKFNKTDMYKNRREWNFNYEPHLRQKLAYDLMRFAGVRSAKPQHVLLSINGEPQGLYLQYEDLDNTEWLKENFSDDDGDLYKAGYDLPDDIPGRRFSELTFLGEDNDIYFGSYNKKKTKDNVAKTDNTSIKEFTRELGSIPDEDIPGFFENNVVVDRLISYLVVASFISHWDSYPYRPKNYWFYQNPDDDRWSMLPWDLDGAFAESALGIPNWGIEADLFFQYDQYDAYTHRDDEGRERPFVRRLMRHDEYRQAYLARYRELMTTLFSAEYLEPRVNDLQNLVRPVASPEDQVKLDNNLNDLTRFIRDRRQNVTNQLTNL